MGNALMISRLANDSLITSRHSLPVGSAINIWFDVTTQQFVCESAAEAAYDAECP